MPMRMPMSTFVRPMRMVICRLVLLSFYLPFAMVIGRYVRKDEGVGVSESGECLHGVPESGIGHIE